jgi:hypothetical protein
LGAEYSAFLSVLAVILSQSSIFFSNRSGCRGRHAAVQMRSVYDLVRMICIYLPALWVILCFWLLFNASFAQPGLFATRRIRWMGNGVSDVYPILSNVLIALLLVAEQRNARPDLLVVTWGLQRLLFLFGVLLVATHLLQQTAMEY